MKKTLEVGQEVIYRKVHTKEEVEVFGRIMGFMGKHHEIPNEQGQVLNQGLLTALLTNRIGGEYNILMYSMDFSFLKKVWTGEEIRAVNKVLSLENKGGKDHIKIESSLYNEADELVLRGNLAGILLDI